MLGSADRRTESSRLHVLMKGPQNSHLISALSTMATVAIHLYSCIAIEEFCKVHSQDHTLRKRTSFRLVQRIEQSKYIKLTIDTNIHLTLHKALHFSQGP